MKVLAQIIYATLISLFIQISNESEYLVSQEFTTTNFSSAPGWSLSSAVNYCWGTKFIDWSGSKYYVGVLGLNNVQQKTYSSLPPHWSLSVRFDLLLFASLDGTSDGDMVYIYIDNVLQNTYTKDSSDGQTICYNGPQSWYDELVLYSKNVTHTANSVTIKLLPKTNEGPDNEGFLFKNYYLYLDTCDISCASCSGPASNQCISCPANSTLSGGTCTCQTGYNQHLYSCVSSCPTGYVLNANSPSCKTDYSINCSTVNNSLQICTACSSGYLYKGYCVASCPQTATLTGGVCKDFDSALINGQYLINGLSNNYFGQSEITGMGLQVTNFKGLKSTFGTSGALTSNCGTIHVLGGFWLSGSNAVISRTWAGLAPHWSILVGYTYWKIDSWDSEIFYFKVDGTVKQQFQYAYSDGPKDYCGYNNYNDVTSSSSLNFTHTSSSLAISFYTNLDEDVSNESFALSNLYVLVDFCTPNCATCDASGCLTCQATYLMYYKKCYNPCPIGSYQNSSTTCADCNSNCRTCVSPGNICTSCNSPNFLNPGSGLTCLPTCPVQYWPRTSDRTCQQCDSTCYTCNSPGDANSCASCNGSRYLSNNQCILTCPNGTYASTVTNNNQCLACNSQCATCSGPSASNCLSCNLPNYFQSSSNTCVASCNSNQYGDTVQIKCISCDSTCTTCTGPNNNNCISCTNPLFFNSVAKTCVSICPNGTYNNTTGQVCSNCNVSCTTCNGGANNNCLSCTYPSLYYQASSKTCVASCNSNQYANSTSPPTCQNCDISCTTCSGTASNNCLSCSGSLYLSTSGNLCTNSCQTSEFKNGTNQCVACNSNCLTCSGNLSTNCLSCSTPNFYQATSNTCVATCNSNQYGQTTPTRQCINCNSTCTTCFGSSSNNCSTCSGSYFLDSSTNSCVTTCPNGTYNNSTSHQCSPCHSDCTTCNGPNNTQCLTCSIPRYFQSSAGQCVLVCNSNQYKDDPTASCKSCNGTCTTCSGGASNNCTSCSGALYLNTSTNTCVSTCPTTQYSNATNNICTNCEASCTTCNGGSSSNCLTCSSPLFFQPLTSQCVGNCSSNQYPVSLPSPICKPCDSSCTTCNGSSNSSCLSCSGSSFLYDPTQSSSSCQSVCPDGTYQNLMNNQCSKCDSTCKTCSNSLNTNCLSCSLPRYFQPSTNQCVLNCQQNQYTDDSTATCRSCNSSCASCSESSADTKCLSCTGTLYFNSSTRQCLPTCPDTYYQNTTNNVCTKCDNSCYLCNGGTASDCLSCQLPLYYQLSTKQCVSTCFTNQYKDSSQIQCNSCDPSCTTCSSSQSNNCLSCSNSTFLNQTTHTCVATCPDGTFANSSNNNCTNCDTSCKTCSSDQNTSCLSCTLPLLYQSSSHQCVSTCNSNQYPDNSIPQCMNCDTSCSECNGPLSSNCTKCSGLNFLNPLTNQCVQTCPVGYYKNISNNQCSQCNTTCNTCSGPNATDCLDCVLPRYYQSSSSSCVTSCNSNQYKNDSTISCQSCDNSCASCSGPLNNQCTSCTGLNFLNTSTNQCIQTCPDGQYDNTINNICTNCDSTCTTCNGGSNTQCIKCTTPRYYQSSTSSCDTSCYTNQYKDDPSASCKSCDNTCSSCSGPNNNQCLTCSGSLFLDSLTNQCVSNCPDSYYANTTDNICQKCDPSCKTCSNKFNTSCLNCSLPLYYQQSSSTCVSNCDQNQYKDDTNAQCASCNSSCSTCSGSADNQCLSCPSTTYLNLQTLKCQNSCLDGTFENTTNNQCTNCDPSCLTCSGGSNNSCLSCTLPLYYQPLNNSCNTTCNSNQYADSQDVTCKQCQSTCTTCSGPLNTQCLSCSGTKYLSNNQCIDTCPNGLYSDTSDNKCKSCNTSCQTCNGNSSSNCLSCPTNTYLYQNQCLSDCPNSFFKQISNLTCMPCSNLCGNCTDSTSTSCTSCPPGYLLQETSCVVNCSSSYFQEPSSPNCTKCDITCKTCTNSTNSTCSSCSAPTYLYNGQCINSCPDGYFASTVDNTCKQCDSTCKTCNGGTNSQCTTCNSGRFLYTNICMSQCPDGLYNNISNQTCTNCNPSCTTCSDGTNNDCNSCSGLLFLYQNQCINICPDGFYSESSNNKCQPCDSSCKTCTSFTSTSCVSCASGTFLQSNTCTSTCSSGTYGESSTNTCNQCDTTCNTCSGASSTQCQTCIGTKFEYQNSCLDNCPSGYYQNQYNNTCTKCDETCKECIGNLNSQCTSCSSSSFLYNNQCVLACPSGLYKSSASNSCEKCDKSCLNCSGPSDKECLSCKQGALLQETQCVDSCSSGYFQNKDLNNCSKCHPSCQTCTGPNYDQCELCPDLLIKYESKCIVECSHNTYLLQLPVKQCFQCNNACSSSCNGPKKEDCDTLKIQNQLIVYILTFKTLLWIASVIIGILKDTKNQDESKSKIMPLTQSKIPFADIDTDSPVQRRRRKIKSDFENVENDSPTHEKQKISEFDNSPYPQSSQFFPQTLNELQEKNQMTFQNEGDQSPKSPQKTSRRRPRRTQFIINSKSNKLTITNLDSAQPLSNNASQVNTARGGASTQALDQLLGVTTVGNSQAPSSIFGIEKSDSQQQSANSYSANEKLKYSFLGNEWMSLFSFYDPSMNRVCRTTLIYLKYQMFFFICEHFKLSPLYYILICLISGLALKLVLSNFMVFMVKYFRYGNGIMLVMFVGAIGVDLGLWFIPKLLSINYNQDLHWSILYAITFSIDFVILQQIVGLLQYLSTIKFLNHKDPSNNIHNYFKNKYLLNKLKN